MTTSLTSKTNCIAHNVAMLECFKKLEDATDEKIIKETNKQYTKKYLADVNIDDVISEVKKELPFWLS